MRTIFARERWGAENPASSSIFLAGPTLRDHRCRHTKSVMHEAECRVPAQPCGWCKNDPDFRERSWRQDAVDQLSVPPHEDVTLFIPEFRDWRDWTDVDKRSVRDQDAWEIRARKHCLVHVFWIPRDMDRLPGLTTNLEFGESIAEHPGRIILGAPPNTPGISVLRRRLDRWYGGEAPFYYTLDDALNAALYRVRGDLT